MRGFDAGPGPWQPMATEAPGHASHLLPSPKTKKTHLCLPACSPACLPGCPCRSLRGLWCSSQCPPRLWWRGPPPRRLAPSQVGGVGAQHAQQGWLVGAGWWASWRRDLPADAPGWGTRRHTCGSSQPGRQAGWLVMVPCVSLSPALEPHPPIPHPPAGAGNPALNMEQWSISSKLLESNLENDPFATTGSSGSSGGSSAGSGSSSSATTSSKPSGSGSGSSSDGGSGSIPPSSSAAPAAAAASVSSTPSSSSSPQQPPSSDHNRAGSSVNGAAPGPAVRPPERPTQSAKAAAQPAKPVAQPPQPPAGVAGGGGGSRGQPEREEDKVRVWARAAAASAY